MSNCTSFKLNVNMWVILIAVFHFGIEFLIAPVASEFCSSTIAARQFPDYYWRDYVGIIPEDAVAGGTDKSGNPTYVGQAYIKGFEILPVTIYRGCKYANTTAYGKEKTTDQNIKILCAQNPANFVWIPTKNEETHLLTNYHFVVGGYEVGHNLNIGRVQHDGRIIIGKIFSYPLPNRGLSIPYNGKPILFQSYEILTYNYEKNKSGLDIDIDVRYQQ